MTATLSGSSRKTFVFDLDGVVYVGTDGGNAVGCCTVAVVVGMDSNCH